MPLYLCDLSKILQDRSALKKKKMLTTINNSKLVTLENKNLITSCLI